MADMEAALLARIKADATVAGLVGTRVTWVDRPQTTALPAITLQTIVAPRAQHMGGMQDTQQATVQADVWAKSYGSARAIREALIAAVSPATEHGGVAFDRAFSASRDGGEDVSGTFVHRHKIDFRLTYAPA